MRWIIGTIIVVVGVDAGLAQGPVNIPPTAVPQTAEPPLNDPRRAGELPDKLREELLTPRPGGAMPASVTVAPTDPPTPIVAIHVAAPASVALGTPVTFTLTVENKSSAAAHHVRVTNPIAANAQFNKAEPPPDEVTQSLLTWRFGTLKGGETRTIKLELAFKGETDEAVENIARVHFEHGQKVRTTILRPQITIKKFAHQFTEERMPTSCRIVVENTGSVDVTNITVLETLEEGLEFLGEGPKQLRRWEYERIKAGQRVERDYKVMATRPGSLKSDIVASGERGVIAKEVWRLEVGKPPLKMEVSGPDKVYLNYPATYQIRASNTGTLVLDNVAVSFALAKGMTVERASQGGQSFSDRVQWPIGALKPGEVRVFTVTVRSSAAGKVPNIATAMWRGPEQRAEAWTDFMGASALQLSVRESKDPIAVGEKVQYVLTIQNRGTTAAKDVKIIAQFPVEQYTLVDAESDGKLQPNRDLLIGPLVISPNGTVTKTITLKATRSGVTTVHIEMASPDLPSGNVIKEESTTIVGQ